MLQPPDIVHNVCHECQQMSSRGSEDRFQNERPRDIIVEFSSKYQVRWTVNENHFISQNSVLVNFKNISIPDSIAFRCFRILQSYDNVRSTNTARYVVELQQNSIRYLWVICVDTETENYLLTLRRNLGI